MQNPESKTSTFIISFLFAVPISANRLQINAYQYVTISFLVFDSQSNTGKIVIVTYQIPKRNENFK